MLIHPRSCCFHFSKLVQDACTANKPQTSSFQAICLRGHTFSYIFYPRSFWKYELTYTSYIACILVYTVYCPRTHGLIFFRFALPKSIFYRGMSLFQVTKKKRWIFRSNLSRPADWKKLIFPFNSSAFTVTMPQRHSMTSSPVHLCRLFMVQSSKSNALKPVKESK